MDSSATLSCRAQFVPKQCDNNNFLAKKKSLSHRARSSSSSSSCSSSLGSLYFPDESPVSPDTPLKFSGVPFSWESLPGIPKKNAAHKKKDYLLKELPPPPASTPFDFEKEHFRNKKQNSPENFKKDPFIAALVECSKDDGDGDQDSGSRNNFFNGAKVTRSVSDRFGFINIYTSCKRTCAVSESLVYLPRSTRTSYDLIPHHHHHHHHHRRRGNP